MKTNYLTSKTIHVLITFLICTFSVNVYSQTISGRVMDKDFDESLPYANVILLHAKDSSLITGTVTNDDGYFALNGDKNNCLVQISFLGYDTYVTPITSEEMGTIYLSSGQTNLSEVTVRGTAKTFRMENGGISADIQNSRLKLMGNLSDVLGQLPFVAKNQEAYEVLGKGEPIFYINNRLVRDNNEIEQLSSQDIKKITVITGPGAEYDSSVNAVIKIETIRPTGEGISGSINTFDRYNSKWYSTNQLSLNYRKGGLDIFGSMYFSSRDYPKDRNITNEIQTVDNDLITLRSFSKENDGIRSIKPIAGINYLLNENHSFGARYEYEREYNLFGNGNYDIEVEKNNLPEQKLNSDYDIKTQTTSHYINGYYNARFGEFLTAKLDIDYKTKDKNRNSFTHNILENGNLEDILTHEDGTYDLYAGKLTFESPVWDGNLTFGTELSYTDNLQNFIVDEDSGVPGIIGSKSQSKQNLVAGFLSYGRSFGNFSANIGIRYENTHFKYYVNDVFVDAQSKNSSKLFPNLRLSYRDENFQMQLAYRQTIQRPSYSFLNATTSYISPYRYYSGNPSLQPTYQNSLSYTFMWKNLTFMASYNDYKDLMTEISTLYMGNSILGKPVNLDKKDWMLSANYSPTFGIWKPSLEVSFHKNILSYGTPEIKYNHPRVRTMFRNNILLNGWQLGVDISASTSGHLNTEYMKSSWKTGLYVNKSFLDDKLTVNINANDVFNTARLVMKQEMNNITDYWDWDFYQQNISIQLTYRFNATKTNRYKGSRATDELNRL